MSNPSFPSQEVKQQQTLVLAMSSIAHLLAVTLSSSHLKDALPQRSHAFSLQVTDLQLHLREVLRPFA